MLNDLELDKEKFDSELYDIIANNEIVINLELELKKFKNKVDSRREKVAEYKLLLEKDDLREDLKFKYRAFISKVEINENNYLRERQMIIRRSLMFSFEKISNGLSKLLLG